MASQINHLMRNLGTPLLPAPPPPPKPRGFSIETIGGSHNGYTGSWRGDVTLAEVIDIVLEDKELIRAHIEPANRLTCTLCRSGD